MKSIHKFIIILIIMLFGYMVGITVGVIKAEKAKYPHTITKP